MHINNLLYARRILMKVFNVFISVKEGLGGGFTNAYINGNTKPFLQNRLMDVDQTW